MQIILNFGWKCSMNNHLNEHFGVVHITRREHPANDIYIVKRKLNVMLFKQSTWDKTSGIRKISSCSICWNALDIDGDSCELEYGKIPIHLSYFQIN